MSYHKINSVFKRLPEDNRLIEGQWSEPEYGLLRDISWCWTEKVDGMNVRVSISQQGTTLFQGRTDKADLPRDIVTTLEQMFPPGGAHLSTFRHDTVIYGEGYGPKIQKVGRLYSNQQEFVMFDIRVGDTWLNRSDVKMIGSVLGIPVVPVVGYGTLLDAIKFVRGSPASCWNQSLTMEGLVCRPDIELLNKQRHRIITKVKVCDFVA